MPLHLVCWSGGRRGGGDCLLKLLAPEQAEAALGRAQDATSPYGARLETGLPFREAEALVSRCEVRTAPLPLAGTWAWLLKERGPISALPPTAQCPVLPPPQGMCQPVWDSEMGHRS